MNPSQNVLRIMSTDARRGTATPLNDGCNNNRTIQISPFNYSLCFSSTRRHHYVSLNISETILHRLRWKCNCSCVLGELRNKFSKFHKISARLTKIMLNILWLCFFGDTVYNVRSRLQQSDSHVSSYFCNVFI